ncbi:MAG: energy-coupling factor transporter ATPase [Velocimicrobium sp.]
MCIINAKNMYHSYEFEGSHNYSLRDINLNINKGEFVAILGRNGCGKSTLAKHFNALLEIQQGELSVCGFDVRDKTNVWDIRKHCGMVFQNPDNQFVSSIVYEDIAFGLRNYDIPEASVPHKVQSALTLVGMTGYEDKSPHMLSGGQKQRIAIAGVLALEPELMIFDEATSMLDPEGRREVLKTMQKLHHEENKTILMITHYVEEAVLADKIIFMDNGQIIAEGKPQELLINLELLTQTGLAPLLPVKTYYDLFDSGIKLRHCPLTIKELVQELCQL